MSSSKYTNLLVEKIIKEAEELDPKVEKQLKDNLDTILQSLPADLDHFTDTQGDKDSELDIVAENDMLNEALGTALAGLALSGPAITSLIGKAGKWLGLKLNKKIIQNVGEHIYEFGEKWHKAYEDAIAKVVSKLVPKNTPPQKVEQVSRTIFMIIVAAMGASAIDGATAAAAKGQTTLASAESVLSAIKGKELVPLIRKAIPKLLNQVFA